MSVSRNNELLRANQSYSAKYLFISCPLPWVHSILYVPLDNSSVGTCGNCLKKISSCLFCKKSCSRRDGRCALFCRRYSLFNGCYLSGSFFCALAFALALSLALAFAFTLALAFLGAAGASGHDLLRPSDDLVAIGSNDLDGAGDSGQSSQNLQNGFHRNNLHNQILQHPV